MEVEPSRWWVRRPMTSAIVMLASRPALSWRGVLGGIVDPPGGEPARTRRVSTSPSNQSQAQLSAQSDQDMVDFARCMRQHGVQMSDPVPPPRAQRALDRAAAANFVDPRRLRRLQPFHCQGHPGQGSRSDPTGRRPPAGPHAATRPACAPMTSPCPIRHHRGNSISARWRASHSDFGRYSPQFRSADSACRHLLPAGTHDDGTGP